MTILFCDILIKNLTNSTFEPYWRLLIYGVMADAFNLLIGALTVHISITDSTKNIIKMSAYGLISMIASFGLLFWSNNLTTYLIGLPLIFSQFIVVFYMYWNFRKSKNELAP